MAIFFTLLYIFTAYLAPSTVFGDLAAFHVEQVIVALALIASVFSASGSGLWKLPQSYAMLGLMGAISLSLAFNGIWFAAPAAVLSFLTDGIAFFLIVWNIRTRLHIQLLVATLLAVALITVVNGAIAFNTGIVISKWIFIMGQVGENPLLRIRGLGFINDPNDLCQFLIGLIPCVFIFWRSGNFFRNLVFVLLPVATLLYGMFLTHSRGGMVGLLAALMLLGRRKFGLLPAVISGAVGFLALSAAGWSGGREVNADSGSDRTEAWATGLKLIRSHPLFGVGYRRFTEYFYITAHNTVVVCAAEIGLVGFFFWILLVFPTIYDVAGAARNAEPAFREKDSVPANLKARRSFNSLVRPPALESRSGLNLAFAAPLNTSAPLTLPSHTGFVTPSPTFLVQQTEGSDRSVPDDEIRRICSLMLLGLTGFLASGWFLSRPYTMVLLVNIGLALTAHRLAVERGLATRLTLSKAAKYSAMVSAVVIALVYILLRITNLLPKSAG